MNTQQDVNLNTTVYIATELLNTNYEANESVTGRYATYIDAVKRGETSLMFPEETDPLAPFEEERDEHSDLKKLRDDFHKQGHNGDAYNIALLFQLYLLAHAVVDYKMNCERFRNQGGGWTDRHLGNAILRFVDRKINLLCQEILDERQK